MIDKKEKRTHCVSVRFRISDLERLDADRGKLTRGSYIYSLYLHGKPPSILPKINLEQWQKLSRVSSNLNQIAHHLNAGGGRLETDILDVLQETKSCLVECRKLLLAGDAQ